MNKKLLAGLIATLLTTGASAFEPFTVKDIRLDGIQRTEAGTVFSYLPIKVGDTLTDDKAAQAIKSLFATGFFKDVRLEIDGDVVVVALEERPAIAQIDFVGLKEFDKEQLTKGLKESGFAVSRSFDRSMLDRAGTRAPIMLARSTRCLSPGNPSIRAAIAAVVSINSGFRLGPDTDTLSGKTMRDGCHFTAEGLNRAARMWAETIDAEIPTLGMVRHKP